LEGVKEALICAQGICPEEACGNCGCVEGRSEDLTCAKIFINTILYLTFKLKEKIPFPLFNNFVKNLFA
jgi:hypothetical protein